MIDYWEGPVDRLLTEYNEKEQLELTWMDGWKTGFEERFAESFKEEFAKNYGAGNEEAQAAIERILRSDSFREYERTLAEKAYKNYHTT